MPTAASAKPMFLTSFSMHMMSLLGSLERHLASRAVREQTRRLKAVSTKLNGESRENSAETAGSHAAGLRTTGFSDADFSNNECGFGKLRAMSKI